MASQKKVIAAAVTIIAVMAITTAWAVLQTSKTIPSTGTIYAYKLGVFSDSGCTDAISQINWTTVNPGASTPQVVYVKNLAGSLNMKLSMTTTGWSASNTTDVANVTWDRTDTTLTPSQVTMATITLSIADNNETQAGLSFTVNVKIIGVEV